MSAVTGTRPDQARYRRPAARRGALGSLATTPGRLQLAMTVLTVLAVLAGLFGALAAYAAGTATKKITSRTEPMLVNAATIYTSLAEADAIAAQAFLAGGLPPPEQTERYRTAVERAGGQLAEAARRTGDSGPAADAIRTLTTQLPVYTGLVEAARANNRQGFPVGAAYLTRASTVNREQLLPAAQGLFDAARDDMADGYGDARATLRVRLAVTAAVVLLAGLVVVQWWLFRRTRRILNPALVLATGLAVLLAGMLSVTFVRQADRLDAARAQGSDPVGVLARARNTALLMSADEALTLVGRGNGGRYEVDFTRQQKTLVGDGDGGLLATAADQAGTPAQQRRIAAAGRAAAEYGVQHAAIRRADDGGRYDEAVRAATRTGAGSASAAFAELDRTLGDALQADQEAFDRLAGSARTGLGAVGWIAVLLAAGIAAAAAIGIRVRLLEYR